MIRKSAIIYLIFIFIFFLRGMQGFSQNEKSTIHVQKNLDSSTEEVGDSITNLGFDSLLIIHFHPTAQCSCCINVGNFSKKGLEKFYSKPYKEGRFIFKECNIDEDTLTAKRYKIFWSALGFKKLSKKKEEFKEIKSVWEFCEDEEKFLINFKKELQSFVAGKKEEKSEKNPK